MATQLTKATATGGYLQKLNLEFAPGLNCIIGARGTCKSTIVESLRCLFSEQGERVNLLLSDPKSKDKLFFPVDQGRFVGMVFETLVGGTLQCEVLDASTDERFVLERDVTSGVRVYKDGIKELPDENSFSIEIYSQGDLQRLADDETLRMTLIDKPNQRSILALRNKHTKSSSRAKELGVELRTLRAHQADLEVRLRELPSLIDERQRLVNARPEIPKELEEIRTEFLRHKEYLGNVERIEIERRNVVTDLEQIDYRLHELKEYSPVIKGEGNSFPGGLPQKLQRLIENAQKAIDSALEELRIPITDEVKVISDKFAGLETEYQRLSKAQEHANFQYRKEDEVQKRIVQLTAEEEKSRQLVNIIRLKEAERNKSRAEVQSCINEVFALRSHEVKKINESFGKHIILSIEPGSQSQSYLKELNELLKGSRLRGQEELTSEIASAISPSELIDLVENNSVGELAGILGRDAGQMTRLLASLADAEKLYDLETLVMEDRLDIQMYDGLIRKPVHTLSNGQKATALLPLILREAAYPLIVDQPEDDLDNRFIYEQLVKSVENLKKTRQLIFVTHNANIPVLGEADRVFVMEMETPAKAKIAKVGGIEECRGHIIDLLEGGREAFNAREKKYHDLL